MEFIGGAAGTPRADVQPNADVASLPTAAGSRRCAAECEFVNPKRIAVSGPATCRAGNCITAGNCAD